MAKYDKVDLAFKFLSDKEKSGDSFTLEELSEHTTWTIGSCRTYVSKRWHQYIENDDGHYSTSGIRYLSEEEFREVHSQKLNNVVDMSSKGILLKKAKEFALLAVSTYNNPFTTFKSYGFIVNIIIAWTALLHAIFEKKGVEYFYKDEFGQPILKDGDKKAWELSKCCEEFWPGAASPEKTNLLFLIGLRNKIEHRSLPALDLAVIGECQACLCNFESLLVEEFGDIHALMAHLAIALQLTRTSQQSQIDALKQLQKENYRVVREFMETYKNDLSDDVLESQKYRIRAFLIPKIGNHAKTSDLAVEFINTNKLTDEELRSYEQGIAFIKGIESPYKLKPSKVVEAIKERHAFFNTSLHTKCWKFYTARPNHNDVNYKGEFAGYIEGFDGYLYSLKWIKFLISEISDQNKLAQIRAFRI
ncbi:DUF3644 domain-containing protein [Shewanella mangrovisoli]|uniref:DUF3644 domain-containing protein n=1 Tax=Shewanella mangrovisoli TaxID=2864211 RepID=UPI0035BAC463